MPKINPTLFIVAGPNGAGKSTTSKEILKPYNITAFDWDAEFYREWKKFSYDPIVEQGVSDSTSEKFNTEFEKALRRKNIFAYETNFHTKNDSARIQKAKKVGYNICIIFFYMPTVKKCIERVKDRVRHHGHHIPDEVVKERFYEGLRILNKELKNVDALLLFNASLNWQLSLAMAIDSGKVIHFDSNFFKADTQLKKLPRLRSVIKSHLK